MGEVLKDARVGFRGDADAGVGDANRYRAVLAGAFGKASAQHDLAGRGEFDRVAEQVGDDLPDAEGVAVEHAGCAGAGLEQQLQAFLPRGVGKQRQGFFEHLAELELDAFECKPA